MDIKLRFSFQIEKKALRELIELVKNPLNFFKKNESTEEECLNFLTFIIRVGIVINIPIKLINPDGILKAVIEEGSPKFFGIGIGAILIASVIAILLSRIMATIGLVVASHILNFLTRIIGKKDNLVAAERVIAYSSPTFLLTFIPKIGSLVYFISVIILHALGILKQYKLTLSKSSAIAVIPPILIGVLFYFLQKAGWF